MKIIKKLLIIIKERNSSDSLTILVQKVCLSSPTLPAAGRLIGDLMTIHNKQLTDSLFQGNDTFSLMH
jgi:hypothetical protein